jgi:hypothetical protein
LRALPLIDADGEGREWFGTATDITARKLAEEAVMRSERMASLGRMAATISHEINNPLKALANLLYLASTTNGCPVSHESGLRMRMQNCRGCPHYTAGARIYRESNAAARVDLSTLVDSVITLLKNKMEVKHARIEKQLRGRTTSGLSPGTAPGIFEFARELRRGGGSRWNGKDPGRTVYPQGRSTRTPHHFF